MPQGVGRCASAVAGAELGVHVGDVSLDGARAQDQRGGDLLVAVAGNDLPEDLRLAPGQAG